MRRVDRHGCKQRIEFALTILFDKSLGLFIEFVEAQHPNPLLGQFRTQSLVPGRILFVNKFVGGAVDKVALLDHGQAARSARVLAIFELLQQATDTDLKELVKIARRNSEKLHALEKRIIRVLGLFEHARVKLQPRLFAVQKKRAGVGCFRHKTQRWTA